MTNVSLNRAIVTCRAITWWTLTWWAMARSVATRRLCLVAAGALLAVPVFAQDGSFLREDAPFRAFETRVPMRDGKSLAADVYVPRDGEPRPVVLIQTPYDKTRARPWFVGEGQWGKESLFTKPDYAFVVTDWRGRFASSDAASPAARPGGGEDGYDTVQWAAAQPWSSGKVGTWGPSALGAAQYRTAAARPPALACAVPVVMPLNLTYEVYFPGGALWEEFVRTLGRLGWPVYEQLTRNPAGSAFWETEARRNQVRPEQLDVPMLLVGGWFDIYVDPVLETFAELRSLGGPRTRGNLRLVMGPWLHRTDQLENGELQFPAAAGDGLRAAERFFDGCLRGVERGKEPAITYFQIGSDEWRTTDVWPPQGAQIEHLHLASGGGLHSEPSAQGAASSSFRYDPNDPVPVAGGHVLTPDLPSGPRDLREKVESRSDVLIFTGEALSGPLEVAGPIEAELWVATDRRDTDFVALLADVHPDGRSILLSEGIRRLRFRNTSRKEELALPGEVYRITVELTDLAVTFLPGHRLRLLVTSSYHPKYHRNPNDGGPLYGEEQPVVASNQVFHDAVRPSALLLPVIEQRSP